MTLNEWDVIKNAESHLDLPSIESILDNIGSGFFVVDSDWIVTYANKSIETWTGKKRKELLGYNIWKVIPEIANTKFYDFYHRAMEEQETFSFEEFFEPTDAWLKVTVVPSSIGLLGYVCNSTEHKRNERMIKHMAYYDYLTDLPNRRCFEKRLEDVLAFSKQNQRGFALLSIDIDRFKYINDALGPSVGDQLIHQFAARLVQLVGNDAFVARIGGDSFAIMLDRGAVSKGNLEILARNINTDIEEHPFYIQDFELYTTASLGICLYPEHGEDAESLIKHSDIALYGAKENGRNTYAFYNPILDIDRFKRILLVKGLRQAIEQDELELYYQPRVNTKTGRIQGVEALLRWNHPEWGMVSPADFIPIAEETGLIHPLTTWVVQTACKQIWTWKQQCITPVPISINVTAKLFISEDFVRNMQNALEETAIEGNWIEVEITETSILDNERLVELSINRLKKLGLNVSIDDFGTGYSSLAYLSHFKVDVLKIDRSFMRDIITNQSNATIVESIIHLAHGLRMKVVAEGVETNEQIDFLREHDCDELQGYAFSKPVPLAELMPLLEKRVLRSKEGGPVNLYTKKRKHLHVSLPFPILSHMTIVRMNDKEICLDKTEVLVEELSTGGLLFSSHLGLAIQTNVIFEFEMQILGEILIVCGYITSKEELSDGNHQYYLEFIIDKEKRSQLVSLLKRLSQQMKINPFVPNCNMVELRKKQDIC